MCQLIYLGLHIFKDIDTFLSISFLYVAHQSFMDL